MKNVPELLFGFESIVALEKLPILLVGPETAGTTFMVTVTVWFNAMFPSEQLTFPPNAPIGALQVPAVVLTELIRNEEGRVSSKVTDAAAFGPRLVTA